MCVSCLLPSAGCGATRTADSENPRAAVVEDESGRSFGADQSRCEHEGRSDREAREAAGPGAVQPNIRRVYAVMGEGDEQRRVLICREVDTNFDGIKDVVRVYNDSGEPTVEAADADYDGKMDVWITFQGGKPSKTEVDTNRDGRPDEVRYYLNGHLRRAQRDTNFDGKPDVWEIYDDGRLQRLGEDLDFDGFVDRWSRDEILAREAEARENAGAPAPPVPGSPAARAEPAGEASGSPTKKKGEKTKRH